jgi:hypothetical protein
MIKKLFILAVQTILFGNIVSAQVTVFYDDFDSYIVGEQLACQNPVDWTTWHNTPCDSVEDAIISNNLSYNGLNSVVFTNYNDVIRFHGGLSSGKYKISFMMYIPNGRSGYFSILSSFEIGGTGIFWAMEAYFYSSGVGELVADGLYSFSYSQDSWILVETIVDLNSDTAKFYLADSLIHTWSWTHGGVAPLVIAATELYGLFSSAEMYVDDYRVENLSVTVDEALKYYPLHSGNYWEYKNYYWELPQYYDSSAHSINVIGDTTLSNNYKYKILLKKNIPDDGNSERIYERVDSSTACIYRYSVMNNSEYLIDSLFAQPGDTVWSRGYYTLCIDEYEDTVLALVTEVKEFEDRTIIPVLNYKFAKNLGFIGSLSCEFNCASSNLVYAVIDGEEYGEKITSVNEPINSPIPNRYFLSQNYPNPFNPSTTINYHIPEFSFVTLEIFDVLGNEIATLVNEEKPAGEYEVEFNPASSIRYPASGIYFYQLRAGTFVQTKKMILLK